MLVRLARLYEDGGRPLARHRAVSIRPCLEGVLSLREGHDGALRRCVRTARIGSCADRDHTLLTLDDAVVLFCGAGVMTITGMERDPVTFKASAQSWYVELCDTGLDGWARWPLAKMAALYDAGVPIARHGGAFVDLAHEGVFSLHEEYDSALRRSVRQARLLSPASGSDEGFSLHDAVVLYYEAGVMTVTGMERDQLTRKATAQTWYMEFEGVAKGDRATIRLADTLFAAGLASL